MPSTAPAPFESVEALDLELARWARFPRQGLRSVVGGVLRFALGTGLEALGRVSGHHELGFPSVEAYALERCERSARWVQESRALARRLAALRAVRRALVAGELSFSMAQVVAKVACADDELEWLAEAQARTVREVRLLAKQRAQDDSTGSEHRLDAETSAGSAELVSLTVTVDCEDAWLFECAGMIVRQVAGLTLKETVEALLAEGTSSLLAGVRRDGFEPFADSEDDQAQRQWEAELSRWREEAEARCEARFRARADGGERGSGGVDGGHGDGDGGLDFDFGGDALAIDAELRRIASELSKRDLALGRLAEIFWNADGWRRLGYATAAQYARERLGMSLSSIKAKRALARRAEKMPELSRALGNGELGYEAARLVASVATPSTVEGWITRAAERTVRYLRDEVDAVQLLARLTPDSTLKPPSEETMRRLAAVESRIVSGAVFAKADAGAQSDPGQMSADLADLLAGFEKARSRSGVARHSGRVALHFWLSAETRRYYRWLERLFERHRPARVSFLRFLCCALIDAWKHTLGSTAEYATIYARDRYRCTSPVCGRRGALTPHHLKYRSAGGDDSLENVASLCLWCHLEGIHGGRLRAKPPASDITWTIGRAAHTVVRGRHREFAVATARLA